MAELVKAILARPIQLCDQVKKVADESSSFKADCAELKAKTEKLAALLRQAARAGSDLCERPTRRMVDEAEQGLDKALALVLKCRASAGLVKRLFTIIPAAAFKKVAAQLENSIGDLTWLLAVSSPDHREDDDYLGLPPIAANEPILAMIWENIAALAASWSSLDARAEAAASLVSLAKNNERYGKLIIEEGGVQPLLKLLKDAAGGEGQESSAKALGLLARDPESVDAMVMAGVCSVFAKILKEGAMKTQSVVAWAISELAGSHPKCQDAFSLHNIIRLLVSHLAFETVQEHSKYAIAGKPAGAMSSIHSVVLANTSNQQSKINGDAAHHMGGGGGGDEFESRVPHPLGQNSAGNQMHSLIRTTMAVGHQDLASSDKNPARPPPSSNFHLPNSSSAHGSGGGGGGKVSLSGSSIKGREYEDPATKAAMKAMAARALWKLAMGNSAICRSITESRALLCFSILLKKGPEEVQKYSAMALMEIAAVAEKDADLRRSAFNPSSPAAKAVVDELLNIVEKADSDLLTPCVKAIGCLAKTFRATETRMIAPLVKLLDERETDVTREAVQALLKFAGTTNYLHVDHSKAILDAGGAKHLVQLVYFGEAVVQVDALVLLCHIAQHVPESEALAQAEVLTVLEWASKQAAMAQDEAVDSLLPEAKVRLELFQSRGSRGFH